jgi:hypothetical protein
MDDRAHMAPPRNLPEGPRVKPEQWQHVKEKEVLDDALRLDEVQCYLDEVFAVDPDMTLAESQHAPAK